MVINTRKYKIDNIELTINEMRLLLLLSDMKYHNAKEIEEYLDIIQTGSVSRLIKRINKKKKIINKKWGTGYISKVDIYIT